MSKLVVINLEKGHLEDGFSPVTAQLWETNHSRPTQFTGCLPPAPEIAELYKRYQIIYQAFYGRLKKRSELEIETTGLNNVSELDFTDICQQLDEKINAWLNSDSFRPIDQQLRARLALNEEFKVIIETEDKIIRKLPWHLWSLFEDYQKAEVSLSSLKYEPIKPLRKNNETKVRILAVIGNSEGIDTQEDKTALEQLPDASTVFLVEPSRQELDKWLWEESGWDILFFAGHSQSHDDKGLIYINKNSTLTITELKNALKHAISRGLKLAVFNSCNGLGLARQLADLHIPQIIVMREDVPDLVAQEFLKHFLTSFSGGQSFYLAVRYARERLQGLEDEFPTASWLPVIFQNPAEDPPTWEELRNKVNHYSSVKLTRHKLVTALIASLVTTTMLVGVRSLGVIQQWEMSAFDWMMRMRPNEGLDQRLLLVIVTEEDIQAQKQRQKSSLSDEALQKLLQKLEAYQPRAIGLDIYRDFSVEAKYPDLANRLRQSKNFFAICKAVGGKQQAIGIAPPNEVTKQRIGFSDVVLDSDLVVRRHLLAMTPDPGSNCKTSLSFSIQLAKFYLNQQGIPSYINNDRKLQLGNIVLNPIDIPTGSYQKFDSLGHQILLNYRSTVKVARQVTLGQVLKGKLQPDWVKNKIVLIGVDAESVRDTFLTPYSTGVTPHREIPGVIIHAHMVSQLLSAVLDNRSLLWVWSIWAEILWIWGWSLLGGIVAVYRWSKLELSIFISSVLLCLFGCSFILLLNGGWVPIVPSLLVFIATGLGIRIRSNYQTKKIEILVL
jgi:CHASE2 domain-containing sensor protein